MRQSNSYARVTQGFVDALRAAVDANDHNEAFRLVQAHTAALDAFLERMLASLELDPHATLH